MNTKEKKQQQTENIEPAVFLSEIILTANMKIKGKTKTSKIINFFHKICFTKYCKLFQVENLCVQCFADSYKVVYLSL